MKIRDFTGIRSRGPLPDPTTVEVPADIADLLDDYVESTVSMLEELEAAVLAYEFGTNVEENASMIRRILHKIKGEASMVGVSDIAELCHQTKFAFEEVQTAYKPDMLLRFKDWTTVAIENMAS